MKKICPYFNLFRFSISSKKIAMSKLAKSKASSLIEGKVSYHYLYVICLEKIIALENIPNRAATPKT